MKIGILTLPLHSNYGGIIQAYALQTVLKRMGHDVSVIKIDRVYKLPLWKKPFSYAKRILNKYILRKKDAIDVFYEQKQKKILPIITQNTQRFIDNYIQMPYNLVELNKKQQDLEAIVVGSDQVWRPKYNQKNIERMYLDFAKSWDVKRIAYAASFGIDQWEYTEAQTQRCKNLINKFDAVSVREKSGVDLSRERFDIDALHVIDPTMLLDASHYVSLIEKENVEKSKGNLFVYVLDKNGDTNRIELQLQTIFGYTPFYSSTDSGKAALEDRVSTKIETWLRSFYDAEFVLTDSFHACVFSIIFNKPFVVYGNVGRGLSRFNSLLRLFNLEDRLLSSNTEDIERVLNTPINWNEVNEILHNQREMSNQFLMEALK